MLYVIHAQSKLYIHTYYTCNILLTMSKEQKKMVDYKQLTYDQLKTLKISNQSAIDAYVNKMRETKMCVTLDKTFLRPVRMPCSETAASQNFQQYSMTKEDFCKLHNEIPDLKKVEQYNSICSCPLGTALQYSIDKQDWECKNGGYDYTGPKPQWALPDGTPVKAPYS